jgi:hypothetical protein
MHRNIARAYNCLQDEHNRVRTACVKILARNDRAIERQLLRASLDDPKQSLPPSSCVVLIPDHAMRTITRNAA